MVMVVKNVILVLNVMVIVILALDAIGVRLTNNVLVIVKHKGVVIVDCVLDAIAALEP